MTWEQGLLAEQRPYVERQLGAGVKPETVVRDLIQMGAEATGATQFVSSVSKSVERRAKYATVGTATVRLYLTWTGIAALASIVAGGLLVLGTGLALRSADLATAGPSISVLARIEAATLLPGILVGVLLRRHVSPGKTLRPIAAAAAALVSIVVIRYLTAVELLRERSALKGHAAGLKLLDGHQLSSFLHNPINIYLLWSSTDVASLVLWDVGFVGIAAFVAVVFSRTD
jgi:hypothetical protein